MSLDNSSGTDPNFPSAEINAVALDIVQHYALNAGGGTVELSLSSLSFGAYIHNLASESLRRPGILMA